jgi:hypothetical protein
MGKYWVHSAPDGLGDETQRSCARGKHCASRNSNGEPALGPRALCSADKDFLVAALEALPDMYLELYLILGEKGSGSGDGPRVSGGAKTPPIPIRPDVNALMARIVEELTSWDARVRFIANRDLKGHEERRRAGVAMSTACRTLAANVDVLLALEPETMNRSVAEGVVASRPEDTEGHVRPAGWAILRKELGGADAAVEIFTLFEKCKSKLGWRPQHQDLLTPCWNPDCEQRMLRRWDGSMGLDDFVECRADRCGWKYEGEQLQRLMVAEELAQQRRGQKEAS